MRLNLEVCQLYSAMSCHMGRIHWWYVLTNWKNVFFFPQEWEEIKGSYEIKHLNLAKYTLS